MTNKRMRIVIPRNPSDLIALAMTIYQKHLDGGATSPLKSLKDRSWDIDGPRAAECKEKNDAAEAARDLSEKLTKERDNLLVGLDAIVKSSRDVLLGINHDNAKRLTEWGFTVIENTKQNEKKVANSK